MNPLSLLQSSHNSLIEQQKTLHMSNLIQAFEDPSIKKLQQYNKNKIQRELLDIANNFYSMMDKISMITWFFKDYKTTLESYRKQEIQQDRLQAEKDMLQEENDLKAFHHNGTHKQQHQHMLDEAQQKSTLPSIFQHLAVTPSAPQSLTNPAQTPQQSQPNPKPLIVLPAKRLQTTKHQIQSVINKLKVMVVKVNTKQSSSFQHVYSTYISRLKYAIKQTLEHSSLKEKQFKMSIIKIMLNYLRKKYVFMKIDARNIYPYHPTRYPFLIGPHNESPMFFINFFVQQLLFFNCQPIRLNLNFSQLLYCPIILMKGKAEETLKISQWYYEQLTLIEPLWRNTLLLVKIYSLQTSLRHPVYYSCIGLKKFQFESDLKDQLDEVYRHFPFMEDTHHNEEQLLTDLETIKEYIYQTLIFQHLKKVLNNQPQIGKDLSKVHIDIEGGFRLQFELSTDIQVKQTVKSILNPRRNESQKKNTLSGILNLPESTNEVYPEPVYKPQFITELLLFYKKKNLYTLKRPTLRLQIQILFKTTLFKLLTQDMEYRTVTPAYSGSLGLYYYEKKTIRKNNVEQFMNNFGEQ